jgi:hypothetical protein
VGNEIYVVFRHRLRQGHLYERSGVRLRGGMAGGAGSVGFVGPRNAPSSRRAISLWASSVISVPDLLQHNARTVVIILVDKDDAAFFQRSPHSTPGPVRQAGFPRFVFSDRQCCDVGTLGQFVLRNAEQPSGSFAGLRCHALLIGGERRCRNASIVFRNIST